MAYRLDDNGDIVINGFEKGIGATPYAGLTDLKSVDIFSVPGEAAISMSSTCATLAPSLQNFSLFASGVSNTFQGTTATPLEQYEAITIVSSGVSGVSTGATYWVTAPSWNSSSQTLTLSLSGTYATFPGLVTGTSGKIVISTITPASAAGTVQTPKHFATMNYGIAGNNFMLDAGGYLWTDNITTQGGAGITNSSSWTYTGNTANVSSGNKSTYTRGNGLVYWRTANSTALGDWDGWLFIFRNGQVDYSNVNGINGGSAYNHVGTFVNGWDILNGGSGATAILYGQNVDGCPHNGLSGPDGNMYFVDLCTTWKIQQTDIVTPTNFSPLTKSSYIATQAHNLPADEQATCIAPLGDNFVIGGSKNRAYVWNGVDQLNFTNAIILAESYIAQAVNANTNVYLFAGNRGNIYVTNGAQANPFAKVPDHISNTIEPYFNWGGAVYHKGKLWFGVQATKNDGTAISGYGGIWAVDINTGAMALTNQLTYGSYAGYPTALLARPTSSSLLGTPPVNTPPAGFGLFAGWVNGTNITQAGIDNTISTPYTNGVSYLISDMIPVGTLLKPSTPLQFEFKTSVPLLSGESVELQVASALNGTFTSAGTVSGDGSVISGNLKSPVQGVQWLLLKAILTGISSSPSFNRITELRIIGSQNKTQ